MLLTSSIGSSKRGIPTENAGVPTELQRRVKYDGKAVFLDRVDFRLRENYLSIGLSYKIKWIVKKLFCDCGKWEKKHLHNPNVHGCLELNWKKDEN